MATLYSRQPYNRAVQPPASPRDLADPIYEAFYGLSDQPFAIETHELVRRFGHSNAVNGLSLRVRRGRCYGFFGRNGAGKTTTIKCLLNLLRPTRGSVRILGLGRFVVVFVAERAHRNRDAAADPGRVGECAGVPHRLFRFRLAVPGVMLVHVASSRVFDRRRFDTLLRCRPDVKGKRAETCLLPARFRSWNRDPAPCGQPACPGRPGQNVTGPRRPQATGSCGLMSCSPTHPAGRRATIAVECHRVVPSPQAPRRHMFASGWPPRPRGSPAGDRGSAASPGRPSPRSGWRRPRSGASVRACR